MTPDQQRAILEAAAKACGIDGEYKTLYYFDGEETGICSVNHPVWNPIANSADTAAMCAKLDINTIWHFDKIVECTDQWRSIYHAAPHDGTDASKEAAWRLAASMVAAKVGGYADDI